MSKLSAQRIHDFEKRISDIAQEQNVIICFPEIKLSIQDLEVIKEPLWGMGMTTGEIFDYCRNKIHGEILQSISAYVTREDQPDFQYLVDLGIHALKLGIELPEKDF